MIPTKGQIFDPFTASLEHLLTRLRILEPDDPMWLDPDTGGRRCEFISHEFATVYVEIGIERAEWHANWAV